MITFGGIIGAGLFVGSSTAIGSVGPAVVVSYAIAGLLVLLVMRMLSEMAMAMPGTQTFPDFARAGVGNWAGYLVGWLYWYFWVVVVAIEAIAGASILHEWIALEVWLITISGQSDISYTINGSEVKVFGNGKLDGNYTVNINAGIKNTWGDVLAKGFAANINFENRMPSVKIHGKGNILPNSGIISHGIEVKKSVMPPVVLLVSA